MVSAVTEQIVVPFIWEPEQRRSRILAPAWTPGVAAVLATIGAIVATRNGSMRGIGIYGLITALPIGWWLGIMAVLLCLAASLAGEQPRLGQASIALVGFVILLHGAAPLLEPVARFPVSWVHAGFVQWTLEHGRTLPQIDARASWPAFFDGGAMLTRLAGTANAQPFLLWFGLVLELLYLLPLAAIARAVRLDGRTTIIGLAVFSVCNWVGQDYFSPQAVNVLLFLVLIAVLLAFFGSDRPSHRTQEIGLLFCTLLIIAAIVISHQLTPGFATAAVAVLAIGRRIRARSLPILMLAATSVYVSYLAVPFWQNHLSQLLGGLGHVGSNVNQGVGTRVHGSDAHVRVVGARILFAAGVLGLGAIAAFIVLRRERGFWPLAALALTPFPVTFLQGYGGEVVLRAYLFALPFVALLIAAAATSMTWSRRAIVLAIVPVLPLFLIARYGNESFEAVTSDDLAAVNWVFDHGNIGSGIGVFNGFLPAAFEQVHQHTYFAVPTTVDDDAISHLRWATANNPNHLYIVVTGGQVAGGVANYDLPRDFATNAIDRLMTMPEASVVFHRGDATVIEIGDPA
jgi:hypothetical protein